MGSKTEKSRVSKITKGYANGGLARAPGESREMVRAATRPRALKVDGSKGIARLDKRARGGKVNGKGKTTVNVIINNPKDEKGAGMPPLPAGGPMLPKPPMAPPMPPMAPPMAGGLPPPGALPPGGPELPLKTGGRAYATGGAVKGTKVQHTDGKNDTKDIIRPKQVTFKTGGRVEAGNARGPKMTAGAGSGEGREEKIAVQKRSKN